LHSSQRRIQRQRATLISKGEDNAQSYEEGRQEVARESQEVRREVQGQEEVKTDF